MIRTERIQVRVTPEERRTYEWARGTMALSEWARQAMNREVRRVVSEAKASDEEIVGAMGMDPKLVLPVVQARRGLESAQRRLLAAERAAKKGGRR